MTPNDMPNRQVKAPRKVRAPRPIRNTQLADQLRALNFNQNNDK